MSIDIRQDRGTGKTTWEIARLLIQSMHQPVLYITNDTYQIELMNQRLQDRLEYCKALQISCDYSVYFKEDNVRMMTYAHILAKASEHSLDIASYARQHLGICRQNIIFSHELLEQLIKQEAINGQCK